LGPEIKSQIFGLATKGHKGPQREMANKYRFAYFFLFVPLRVPSWLNNNNKSSAAFESGAGTDACPRFG
jgi:hypothetical protein